MTNAEKFEEVFGFKANPNMCYMPEGISCLLYDDCDSCPYNKWLDEEYTGISPTGAESENNMADVELVIKISEEEYRWIKKSDENVFADVASKECMLHAIKNGTPLPKGHGKLIDSNILKGHIDKLPCLPDGNFAGNHSALKALINMQPTIIEADRAEGSEKV